MEGIESDIGDENQIEDMRERSFHLLVDSVVDYAIFMLTPKGYVTSWNKGAQRINGYISSEILGRHFSLFFTKEDVKAGKPEQELEIAIRDGRVEDEGWRVRKDGSRFWATVVLTALHDKAGKLVGFAKVTRDVSELREAYRFLDAIVENVPNMIFIKEAKELRFIRLNKAGENLLGYAKSDLIGKNDYDFFPKEQADSFTLKDREVLKNQKLVDIAEEAISTRYHGVRVLHTKKVPLYNDSDRPQFLLGISEDITERKQAEKDHETLIKEQFARIESEKALHLRDEFISIAAHELKTPLTALNLQLQLMTRFMKQMDSLKTEKFLSMLKNTKEHLDRFTDLVDNLLDVTRVSAGRLLLDKAEQNLSNVIRRIERRYEVALRKANCTLKLNLDPTIIGVWDTVRLEQVLVNLLTNAMKYGAGKPIEVDSKIIGNYAVITVTDHGIGISEEDRKKIFERFTRVASPKEFSGLGLGLYVTNEIVKAHGGKIRIESIPGKGSTFIVELPLRAENQAA